MIYFVYRKNDFVLSKLNFFLHILLLSVMKIENNELLLADMH